MIDPLSLAGFGALCAVAYVAGHVLGARYVRRRMRDE